LQNDLVKSGQDHSNSGVKPFERYA
jgi:hypothetical protein